MGIRLYANSIAFVILQSELGLETKLKLGLETMLKLKDDKLVDQGKLKLGLETKLNLATKL